MSSALPLSPSAPEDRATIEQAVTAWRSLDASHGAPLAVTTLKDASRKSAVYRLTGTGPSGEDVVAKRCSSTTAAVEHTVYATVLPRAGVPHLRTYGLVAAGVASSWLFVEDAGGVPFSAGNMSHRVLAAKWMAALHASTDPALIVALPDRGLEYTRALLDSASNALRAATGNAALSSDDARIAHRALSACETVAARWDDVSALARLLPETLVHGGFGRKNVHVRDRGDGPQLLAFDWEAAGRGMPAIDLARVDADTYSLALRDAHPAVTPQVARSATALGAALWCASSIPGEAAALGSPWASRVMGKIEAYANEIEASLAALGWNRGRP